VTEESEGYEINKYVEVELETEDLYGRQLTVANISIAAPNSKVVSKKRGNILNQNITRSRWTESFQVSTGGTST
jgi:hypothetical protein